MPGRAALLSVVFLASCGGGGVVGVTSTRAGDGGGSTGGGSTRSSGSGGTPASAGGAPGASGGSTIGGAGLGGSAGATGGTTAGGSGGAATGGSSASGGSGTGGGTSGNAGSGEAAGTGGAAPSCTKLVAQPMTIVISGSPAYHQRRPQLVQRTDGILVSAVMGLDAVESPGPVPSSIAYSDLSPWGAWPPVPTAPVNVTTSGGEAFRATRAGSGLGLLFQVPGGSPGSGLDFCNGANATGCAAPIVLDSTYPVHPLALAQGLGTFLAGWAWELPVNSIHYQLRLRDLVAPSAIGAVGCANEPLVAAAAPSGAGFLIAYSSSRPYGDCAPDNLADGPPTRVQVARYEGKLAFGGEAILPSSVQTLALAPRSDGGAWAAWTTAANGTAASRISPAGGLSTPFSPLAGPFAIADLAGHLAVTRSFSKDGFVTVEAFLFDDAGQALASATIPDSDFTPDSSSFSALASPTGDALLVAWSEAPTIQSGGHMHIRLARFDCAP